jgi:hypothetical protein
VFVALLTITLSNAYPHAFQSSSENDPSATVLKSNILRREEYDPYGFNSILSRFHKRSRSYWNVQNKDYS